MRRILTATAIAAVLLGIAPAAQADDPAFLSMSAGWFDFNRQKDEGAEIRAEYRSDYKIPGIHAKPFAALGGATSGHYFAGAGILWDVFFGRRVVVTPSFAPHFYAGGNKKLDLDYPLEFRSQLEVAYRMDNRSRIGLAVSHYSNASLGDKNPGTETLSLYYSIPLD